jgi:hypothetical protein
MGYGGAGPDRGWAKEKREMGLRWREGTGQGREVAWIRGLGFCFKNSFSFLFKTDL